VKIITTSTVILMTLALSCRHVHKKNPVSDLFYTNTGGFDLKRVPLIKPYEAIKVSDNEWQIQLFTTRLLSTVIHFANEVDLVDSAILIHVKGETIIKENIYNEGWFIVIPKLNLEEGFNIKGDFDEYLSKLHLKDYKFKLTDSVYAQFVRDGYVKWHN